MENIKSKMKTVIFLDLAWFISMKSKNDDINEKLFIGNFVAANFIQTIFKENGIVTKEEMGAIFGNIKDFFFQNYKYDFTQEIYDFYVSSTIKILEEPNSETLVKNFFAGILNAK